ncbi:MAG: host-nuclease inhibitor Gam family protein [Desulfotomaculales bacterium]
MAKAATARRRLEDTALKSWTEVDDTLREIGRIDLEIESMEAEYNRKITDLKEELANQAQPLQERKAFLERLVKEFAETHKDGLDGKKSRELNFGRIGFRQSTKVILRNVKAIIAALKARGMTDCIVIKEEVSKDTLKKYDPATVEAVGAKIKTEDVFWYEVNRDKLVEV